jgi:hypothetical protein
VWVRTTDGEDFLDLWDDGNLDADYTDGTDLIDPVPIPKEGNR